MKTDLVPIRFTFKRGPNGAEYPKFNKVPANLRNGMGWSKFFDAFGSGMHYDKVDNLGTGHSYGTACVLIPEPFALEAAKLPDVEIISEDEFADFWDNRSKVKFSDENVDTNYLQGLLAQVLLEKELGIVPSEEVTEKRKKALNPNDDSLGVRKNKNRRWAEAKKELRLEVHSKYQKKQA